MLFQLSRLRMASWLILAQFHSWLHHICKSSSKTSTSCHKPCVSPFVSGCITLHFHQLVLWNFFFKNFSSLLFLISNGPFSFAFTSFFTSSPAPSVKLLSLLSYLFTGHATYSSSRQGFFFFFFFLFSFCCCCFGRAPNRH